MSKIKKNPNPKINRVIKLFIKNDLLNILCFFRKISKREMPFKNTEKAGSIIIQIKKHRGRVKESVG